jgi:3-hydroxyisobutyrate dehydrogenase-like beta-hydroxyacid dehydrogenase
MTSTQETVGIVGLGLLGSAIVDRLVEAGFDVVGLDLDEARAGGLGIASAKSPADIARSFRRVIICVPDSSVVDRVVNGDNGFLDVADEDRELRLLIDCTTGDPEASSALATKLLSRGVEYVEASVNGSSAVVRAGDGALLVGASESAVEVARDLLDAIASIVYVLGEPGAGARMKLVSNLVLGLNRLALAEGLAFAEKVGLSSSAFLEVIRSGPAHSRALEAKGEKMRRGDFEAEARLAQHLKDVRLMLELSESVGADLPTTRLHRELLERAVEMGLGELDNSAIVDVLRSR